MMVAWSFQPLSKPRGPKAWWNVLDFFIYFYRSSYRESFFGPACCLVFEALPWWCVDFPRWDLHQLQAGFFYPSEVAQKIPGSGGWQDLDRFAMFHLGPEMLRWLHSIRSCCGSDRGPRRVSAVGARAIWPKRCRVYWKKFWDLWCDHDCLTDTYHGSFIQQRRNWRNRKFADWISGHFQMSIRTYQNSC